MEDREPNKIAVIAGKVCSVGAGLAAQAAVLAVATAAEVWKPLKVLMAVGSLAVSFTVSRATEEPTIEAFDRIIYASEKIGDSVAKAVKQKQMEKAAV